MQQGHNQRQIEPMLSFHLMKFAFQDFQKTANKLTPKEYKLAYQHAHEEMLLHKVILSSDDACCVVIPVITLEQTLRRIITEYPDDDTFHRNIKANNMEIGEYTLALHNDLRVETILSRVASRAQSVTADEILSYFNKNQEEFNYPEQRGLDNIKISFNSASSVAIENAYKQIEIIHETVCRKPEQFTKQIHFFSERKSEEAKKTPELFTKSELCPELANVLFSLQKGDISNIIERPDGFSIIRCNEISPAKQLKLQEASPTILSTLLKKKQLEVCRLWLQKLIQPKH